MPRTVLEGVTDDGADRPPSPVDLLLHAPALYRGEATGIRFSRLQRSYGAGSGDIHPRSENEPRGGARPAVGAPGRSSCAQSPLLNVVYGRTLPGGAPTQALVVGRA
jgi:hypothetical protein